MGNDDVVTRNHARLFIAVNMINQNENLTRIFSYRDDVLQVNMMLRHHKKFTQQNNLISQMEFEEKWKFHKNFVVACTFLEPSTEAEEAPTATQKINFFGSTTTWTSSGSEL